MKELLISLPIVGLWILMIGGIVTHIGYCYTHGYWMTLWLGLLVFPMGMFHGIFQWFRPYF